MARTPEGRTLTARHRQRQLQLRALTLRDLAMLWPMWNLGDLRSYERFLGATTTLVRARHRTSAGIAAGYYQTFRVAENVSGEPRVRLAEPPVAARVTQSINSTAQVGVMRALKAGMLIEAARRNGFVRLSGAASRLVMEGGRFTLIDSATADRQALGWARVTGGDPCHFCAMLASRGPVYTSEAAADFQAHDHCMCEPEPHYEGAEWPGRAREFRDLWNESTRGYSGADAVNAFRRAMEKGAA